MTWHVETAHRPGAVRLTIAAPDGRRIFVESTPSEAEETAWSLIDSTIHSYLAAGKQAPERLITAGKLLRHT